LKEQAFSTFLGQNPPFELRPKMGFASDKSLLRQRCIIDNRRAFPIAGDLRAGKKGAELVTAEESLRDPVCRYQRYSN
jgi:hypothetical protein